MSSNSNTAEAPSFTPTEPSSGSRRRVVSSRATLADLRDRAREANLQYLGEEFAPPPGVPVAPVAKRLPRTQVPTVVRACRVALAPVQGSFAFAEPPAVEQRRRHLPMVGFGVHDKSCCLKWAKTCQHTECRLHLGASRSFDGKEFFSCVLDVVDAYPDGLPPWASAKLLGDNDKDGGRVLETETTIATKDKEVAEAMLALYAQALLLGHDVDLDDEDDEG